MADPDNPFAAPPPGGWAPLQPQPAPPAPADAPPPYAGGQPSGQWAPSPGQWGPPQAAWDSAQAPWGQQPGPWGTPQAPWGQQPGPWGPPPGWAPYGWGPPPTSTSGWAVAALVTGLLPLPPLAIGCGIAGLVKTRAGRQAGRGMAIAGVVLGGLWLLLGVLVVTIGIFGGFDAESRGPVSALPTTTVGTCLDESHDTWTVTDCASRHDAEIYYVGELVQYAQGDETGDEELVHWADPWEIDGECQDAFDDYVGESYFSSDHEYEFFAPDEDEQAAGERRFVCVITPGWEDGLRGSARG